MTFKKEDGSQSDFQRLYDGEDTAESVTAEVSHGRVEHSIVQIIDQVAALSPEAQQAFLDWLKSYEYKLRVEHEAVRPGSVGSDQNPQTLEYFKWVVSQIPDTGPLRRFDHLLSQRLDLYEKNTQPPVTPRELVRAYWNSFLRVITGRRITQ